MILSCIHLFVLSLTNALFRIFWRSFFSFLIVIALHGSVWINLYRFLDKISVGEVKKTGEYKRLITNWHFVIWLSLWKYYNGMQETQHLFSVKKIMILSRINRKARVQQYNCTLLLCCNARAYLFSPDDGSLRFLTRNNWVFPASDSVVLQNNH